MLHKSAFSVGSYAQMTNASMHLIERGENITDVCIKEIAGYINTEKREKNHLGKVEVASGGSANSSILWQMQIRFHGAGR